MSSPVIFPYLSQFSIDKTLSLAVFEQIHNQIITLIQRGTLSPGQRLISSREMAAHLGVHRKTVVAAFDALAIQGWIETKPGSGTYISQTLPQVKPQHLKEKSALSGQKAGFAFEKKPWLHRPMINSSGQYHLDDGFPDVRLAPLSALARAYKRQLFKKNPYVRLGYSDMRGSLHLRRELAKYLSETRGLHVGIEQILIVRGTIMGLFLVSQSFLSPGDTVIMGEGGWTSAVSAVKQASAHLLQIPVDENGIITDAIEAICQKQPVRMVYLTPHHNYPTTVTLKADRRLHLLELARKYRFIVFEDDYDYDFHYQNKPLMPLASADESGVSIYCGSFTKSISPAFRVGYLVAPAEVIDYLADFRRIVDRQGDNMLENAVAELLEDGIIQRHLRQTLKTYRQRRDHFCSLLETELPDIVQFQVPEGGLAVWGTFAPGIDMAQLKADVRAEGLFLSASFSNDPDSKWYNHVRLGFASNSAEELEKAVFILKKTLKKMTIQSKLK